MGIFIERFGNALSRSTCERCRESGKLFIQICMCIVESWYLLLPTFWRVSVRLAGLPVCCVSANGHATVLPPAAGRFKRMDFFLISVCFLAGCGLAVAPHRAHRRSNHLDMKNE